MSSQFHKELAIMFDDPFEKAEEERLELEREELRQCEIRKARIALSMLQPLQRERLMKGDGEQAESHDMPADKRKMNLNSMKRFLRTISWAGRLYVWRSTL